ncbi:hypothetical protein EYF80_010407 [Liparis tanakae]|uniref:Uncharacterized protein n=1 Tax=Liparis tanakae TaxID=230148 RepID=A0A4Z2IQE2_9TELE|nr:hypothetical protein EYF80_010407 [Liparis tanakae]
MTQQKPVHHTPIRTFPSVHERLQDILFVGRRLLLLSLSHGLEEEGDMYSIMARLFILYFGREADPFN